MPWRPTRRLLPREIRRSFILIVATIVAFALLWYASLRAAAKTRGAVKVLARAAFLILTSLACIVIGFFLPLAPVVNSLIGSAFWAGLLATAGALAGMGQSDELLGRLETSEAGSASAR
jgi:CHASE2 domain-containing sensor protein